MVFKKGVAEKTSGKVSPWIILLILVAGSFFSTVIPPFQSPDEFDHIKRAYLLTTGTIIARSQEGRSSGGMIDAGLATYISAYKVLKFRPDRKLSAEDLAAASDIQWTDYRVFSSLPGISYYFPVIYAPQAIGLALGERLKLSVDTSYRMARFFVLLSIAVILLIAFRLYPGNPLTIALLILPMTVFQLSSASLDGISIAVAILAIAAFLRITAEKQDAHPGLFYTLVLSVVLIATSRPFMVPMLVLVLAACFYLKKKRNFYFFGATIFFVVAWLLITTMTIVDTHAIMGASKSSVVLFYLTNPLHLFPVFTNTFSDPTFRLSVESFFGILGWLDTPFGQRGFLFMYTCFILIGLLSVSLKNMKAAWIPRSLLLLTALASGLFIFLELLVAWTPHPARVIEGVQGRYFYIPAIMIAYAISGRVNFSEGIFRKIAVVLLFVLGFFTILNTPGLLLERYYVASGLSERSPVVLRASTPLEKNIAIPLFLSKDHMENLQPLKRMGINIGTYMRKNPGIAELQLTAPDGHVLKIPFDLSELKDNQYYYFDLDARPYSDGRISYSSGGGISVWEAHEEGGVIESCLIYEYANGERRRTRGCPRT